MKFNIIILLAGCLFSRPSNAQTIDRISLEECLRFAVENYPLTSQSGVIDQVTEAAIHKVNSYWQPQVALNAQATYQSEVVSLPIESPLFEMPELSKDQYKATIDVTQLIYDGGISHQQKTLQELTGEIEKQKVAVDIYKVKERVVQLYSSALLATENIKLLERVMDDLQTRRKSLMSGLTNGVVAQNTIDLVDAEILKTRQKFTETVWAKNTALRMLGQLTGIQFNEDTLLETPELVAAAQDTTNMRPELDLFELQTNFSLQQHDFAAAVTQPKVSLFAQGGYGRPGLNILVDEFDFYYIAGIKLNLPLWQGQVKKYDASIYSLNMLSIQNQRNLFLLNTDVQTAQQSSEIDKLNELMLLDRELIALREKTMATATVQLDNGVITANDYITEVNAGLQAAQNLAIHRAQLIVANANYLITLGKL